MAEMDWKPIESAPHDDDVLTWTPQENYRIGVICGMHVGYYRTDLHIWHSSDDEWELVPSHWAALPSPPTKDRASTDKGR